MMFSIWEIIDIAVMIVAAGFIFMHLFKKPLREASSSEYEPLEQYNHRRNFWEDFKVAAIIAGPAIVLHELGHKFSAIAFGIPATVHAPYGFLAIAILLILINFPIIFFVAGYVEHASGTVLQNALISIAGPAINLVLWLGALIILKNKKFMRRINSRTKTIINMTAMINMFLFIFNMIPIPGFDGFGFFSNIIKLIF